MNEKPTMQILQEKLLAIINEEENKPIKDNRFIVKCIELALNSETRKAEIGIKVKKAQTST
jgi:hypothetical protein